MRASLNLAFASLISLLLSHVQAAAASGESRAEANSNRCEPDEGAISRQLPAGQDAGPTSSDFTYYVSPSGSDTWSGRLPAPNADGTDGPVLTLARARDLVRARRHADPNTATAAIMLRDGRYQFSKPVIFDGQDAGIRIVAYPGENPELSGAAMMDSSKAKRAAAFVLPMPDNPGREIFVGDIRHSMASRSRPGDPDGWAAVSSPQSGNSFAYRLADFAAGEIAPGTAVELVDRGRSYDIVTKIAAVDPAKGIATVSPPAHRAIENIDGFRLLGRAKWVNTPGRFAWDAAGRQLTVFPAHGTAMLTDGLRVPVLASILVFRSTDHISVSGLKFVETRIADETERDSASIVLDGAHDLTIRGNAFHNVGQAVRLISAKANVLVGNHVSETGSTGIELQDSSDQNLVSDNTLIGIGRTNRAATAIYLHGASGNRIAGNLIDDVARHGIGVDNWDDQTFNSSNLIEGNQVLKTSRTAFDSGAIEMLGRSRKDTSSVIRFNDIRDTHPLDAKRIDPRNKLAAGIYLDDFTSGVLVCGNRISGASLAAIQIHGGSHISVRENLVLLDRSDAVFIFSQTADANEEGQRFEFKVPSASIAPTGGHTVVVSFDNDAVVGGEDRDLFVSRISIGSKSIAAAAPSARYIVTDGRNLPGQTAMPWNGKLVWNLPENIFAENAESALSLYAWSNPAGGVGAHFAVSVDGMPLGDGVAGPAANRMADNNVNGNIVYATTRGSGYFKTVQSAPPPTIKANVFVDKTGQRTDPLVDRAATMTDPGFRNPDHGDFRLNASSPLLAAAFAICRFASARNRFVRVK